MTGLMPLALSPPRSPGRRADVASNTLGAGEDRCLPEVLAHDLERAQHIFEEKNLTSGSPLATSFGHIPLMLPSGDERVTKPWQNSCPTKPALSLTQSPPSVRMQSLGAIQERNAIVSFLDYHNSDSYRPPSDLDSDTETSGSAIPPSFRFRRESPATGGTSLSSLSRALSSKRSSMQEARKPRRQQSWIEADSDQEDKEAFDDCLSEQMAPLAPRPPTPPDSDGTTGDVLDGPKTRVPPTTKRNMSWHFKSHSVSGGIPSRQLSRKHGGTLRQPVTPPNRRTEFSMDIQRPRTCSPTGHVAPVSQFSHWVIEAQSQPHLDAAVSCSEHTVAPGAMNNDDSDSEDSDIEPTAKQAVWARPNTIYIHPSPPPSPMPSVQAWLNSSVQPQSPGPMPDDFAKAVPLPPDTIETLRVSIACFPETMLLSSSLTVETIRTYSRKIRQPDVDLKDISTADSRPSVGKSIWRRVVKYRRGSGSGESPARDHHSSSANHINEPISTSPSCTSLDAPKPWLPLRHVFGCCSDYVCDALYAHLVAYNYMCALTPQTSSGQRASPASANSPSTPSVNSHRPSDKKSQDADAEDIPKKAASVLGLSNQSMSSRLARKMSVPRVSWVPGQRQTPFSGKPAGPAAAAQEQTVKDIRAGLLRCIARLIATARLMAQDGGEERMVEVEAKEVDRMLTQSLCEIVRLTEEAMA